MLFPSGWHTVLCPGGWQLELRVQVYPIPCTDSHEPGLSADELTWGQHFWEQTWRGANDEERAKAAWQQLVERFDAPRAPAHSSR